MRLLFAALAVASAAAQAVSLTGLIRQGRLAEARDAARVRLPDSIIAPGSGVGDIESYAGLFDVGTATPGCDAADRKLFAWYFPPTNPGAKLSEAGTFMWMQGGPGGSGTFGLFSENGPLVVNGTTKLVERREFSWASFQGGIWIDQPLGTGFSTVSTEACLLNTSKQAADDVVDLLDQWATLFPEAASGPFVIAGESYGGTYVPWTAEALLTADASTHPAAAALSGNLDRVLIGDPWADAPSQMPSYPDQLRAFSIVDTAQADVLAERFRYAVGNISLGTLEGRVHGFRLWNAVWGDYNPTGFTSLYESLSGCTDTLNVERCAYPAAIGYFSDVLGRDDVRAALHVPGRQSGANSSLVYRQFAEVSGAFAVGSKDQMESLLRRGVRVLVYHGAVDAICGAITGDALLRSLRYPGRQAFVDAARSTWKVDQADTASAGWVVEASGSNLTWVVIRNAGHLVPFDQPRAAFAMADRFIHGKSIAA